MMRVIGITPSLQDETGRITLSPNYPDAVARAGGLPLVLPLYMDAQPLWDQMLRCCDGLIFSGGGDIDPAYFGEEMLPKSNPPSPLRDQQEIYLCKKALEKDMPVLGICRGEQVLNVAAGGSIYQDFASQQPETAGHPSSKNSSDKVHDIAVIPGTMLEKIMGAGVFQVNSMHHQSLKALGKGMQLNAVAPDGIIEGAEMPGKRFVLGVQWHPEILSALYPEARAIFDAFLAACDTMPEKERPALPLIGLTPSQDEKTGRIIINQDYLDAVYRAGGLPVLLPLYENAPAQWDEILNEVDGLLLTGGADVGPDTYGEEKLPLCGETSPIRDKQEYYLCKKALERDLPVLAICRGHQVLNCVQGGSLYQDIAAQYGEKLRHPCYEVPKDQVHQVQVEKESLLYQITGLAALKVNSRHHQAVKRLGSGLVISARADDGLIEGIEMPDKKFAVGVQWHPESLADYAADAQALFDAFVRACGGIK